MWEHVQVSSRSSSLTQQRVFSASFKRNLDGANGEPASSLAHSCTQTSTEYTSSSLCFNFCGKSVQTKLSIYSTNTLTVIVCAPALHNILKHHTHALSLCLFRWHFFKSMVLRCGCHWSGHFSLYYKVFSGPAGWSRVITPVQRTLCPNAVHLPSHPKPPAVKVGAGLFKPGVVVTFSLNIWPVL